jgi:hypothetical protein
MTSVRSRSFFVLLAAALAWTGLPAPVGACPFCMDQKGQTTMINEVQEASLVLYGKFTNPKLNPERSDLVIEAVLKPHEILGKKAPKSITLPKYVRDDKSHYLLFCDVYKGKIDPYRGVVLTGDGDVVKYLKGLMEIKDKSLAARLRHCFNYLDSPELEISLDAFREFANADYKDYQAMAKKLPADKIAGWLKDAKTPGYRFGLYGSLLGHCGKDKHARVLRKLLDDPDKRMGSGVDGMLSGYIMIDADTGWKYLRGILGNGKEEFQVRHAALRTVQFLWDFRPDLVKKKALIDGICLLLDQSDVADFAIEDLRKWKCWEAADKVLALTTEKYKKVHEVPAVHRSVLRFALSCPRKVTRAAQYVAAERKQDKEYVEDVEELLKLETEAPAKK